MAIRRALAAAALVAACSSDSGPTGPIAIDALAASYESFYCAAAARCGAIDDVATCRSLHIANTNGIYSGLFTDAQIQAAEANLITYDGTAAATCLAGFFSTCLRNYVATPRAAPAECSTMFTATAGDTAPCGASAECISGQCNETGPCTNSCCQGTCLGSTPPPPRPLAGQSCMLNSSCINSYCNSPAEVCTPYLTIGMTADNSDQCEPGLSAQNGTCEPLAATGEPCGNDDDCQDVGDICLGTCTRVGLTGSPCSSTSQCALAFYTCDPASHACALGARLGDSCSQTGACIDQSYCSSTTGTCVALAPDGTSCQTSSECQGHYCDFSTGSPGTCMTFPVCF
jgi:hypothetical protein